MRIYYLTKEVAQIQLGDSLRWFGPDTGNHIGMAKLTDKVLQLLPQKAEPDIQLTEAAD